MGKITGIGKDIFWVLESAFGNGGGFIDGGDIHQGFNPIEGDIGIPKPVYKNEVIYTSESREPDENLSFDTRLEVGEGEFPNSKGSVYHDPLWMLGAAFTHKETSGTWAGGAGTYGQIIGNFSAIDDISSMMIQYKKQDKAASEVISRCLNYVMANSFSLFYGSGVEGILRESAELITGDVNPNTQAFVPNASFDNGIWADWAKSTNYPSKDCRVYWDDSHAAELSEFEIESAKFIMTIPKEYEFFGKSLKVQDFDLKLNEYTAEITGYVYGDALVLEVEKSFASKLKQDLRLQWDTTALEEKHLTFTNAYLEAFDTYDMPSASDVWKAVLTFRGLGTAAYEGNFNNLADPTGRIDLSP